MGDFNTRIRKTSRSAQPIDEQGRRRFEHWLIDNQVYFITSSVRDHQRAFAGDETKGIFWDRFVHYTTAHGFTPWATSLLDSHYHTVGYLRRGEDLPKLMQKLHGSVAKLVNDLLDERLAPSGATPAAKGGNTSTAASATSFRPAAPTATRSASRCGRALSATGETTRTSA